MRTEPSNDPSIALIVAQILSFLWGLAVAPLALLLLLVADTGRGRLFAGAALISAILPLAATIAVRKRTRRWNVGAACGGALWLCLVAAVFVGTPTGRPQFPVRVMHVFAAKEHSFPRNSLGNLLPEGDQLLLGFSLMPLVDPLLTTTQAAELKRLTTSIYRELEGDADFQALGSVMSDSYGELLGQAWQSRHAYVYLPGDVDRTQPRPVFVFFHGSGGNFKAYLWILSKLADRLGFALVAPSGGLETGGETTARNVWLTRLRRYCEWRQLIQAGFILSDFPTAVSRSVNWPQAKAHNSPRWFSSHRCLMLRRFAPVPLPASAVNGACWW